VPWCEQCDRYLAPAALEDGRCPSCGRVAEVGAVAEQAVAAAVARDEEERLPVPWHLKLLAGGVVVYLGYRLWQGIVWVLR
jgi:hypothetical protein